MTMVDTRWYVAAGQQLEVVRQWKARRATHVACPECGCMHKLYDGALGVYCGCRGWTPTPPLLKPRTVAPRNVLTRCVPPPHGRRRRQRERASWQRLVVRPARGLVPSPSPPRDMAAKTASSAGGEQPYAARGGGRAASALGAARTQPTPETP